MPSLRPTPPEQRATEARTGEVRQLADVRAARRHVDVTIPRTSVRGKMRLLSRGEEFDAKADARRHMMDAGYPVDTGAHSALGATEQWLVEVAVRMLQQAVRDPADVTRALASIDEWRECDDQQILALWARYQDLEQELDPIGSTALTDEVLAHVEAAAKKKDPDLLMACGSRTLALYVITTASRPASSETPTSSSGP